jgi:hypothetical protein
MLKACHLKDVRFWEGYHVVNIGYLAGKGYDLMLVKIKEIFMED